MKGPFSQTENRLSFHQESSGHPSFFVKKTVNQFFIKPQYPLPPSSAYQSTARCRIRRSRGSIGPADASGIRGIFRNRRQRIEGPFRAAFHSIPALPPGRRFSNSNATVVLARHSPMRLQTGFTFLCQIHAAGRRPLQRGRTQAEVLRHARLQADAALTGRYPPLPTGAGQEHGQALLREEPARHTMGWPIIRQGWPGTLSRDNPGCFPVFERWKQGRQLTEKQWL